MVRIKSFNYARKQKNQNYRDTRLVLEDFNRGLIPTTPTIF
jgi:hypothetical protein